MVCTYHLCGLATNFRVTCGFFMFFSSFEIRHKPYACVYCVFTPKDFGYSSYLVQQLSEWMDHQLVDQKKFFSAQADTLCSQLTLVHWTPDQKNLFTEIYLERLNHNSIKIDRQKRGKKQRKRHRFIRPYSSTRCPFTIELIHKTEIVNIFYGSIMTK